MNAHVCAVLGFEPCPVKIDWASGPGWLLAYFMVGALVVGFFAAAESRR